MKPPILIIDYLLLIINYLLPTVVSVFSYKVIINNK